MDWKQRCKELERGIKALEKENQELRRRLGYTESVQPVAMQASKSEIASETAVGIHMRSTPDEKIRLFRSLFRGWKDVLARRWYIVSKKKKVDMRRMEDSLWRRALPQVDKITI